jgi:hypothetical protein
MAKFFVELSGRMGLKAAYIPGYGHPLFAAASPFKADDYPHAWNAVWLMDKWWLIDTTAASSRAINKATGESRKEFRTYFFLVPPEQLIWTHFPKDLKWQLLESPVALEQFEQWPYVAAALWEAGVSAEAVHAHVNAHPGQELVVAYADLRRARLLEAPLQKKLTSGQSYSFHFKSADLARMVAISNGKLGSMFVKMGDEFRLTLQAQKGVLRIGAAISDAGESSAGYERMLEYLVE